MCFWHNPRDIPPKFVAAHVVWFPAYCWSTVGFGVTGVFPARLLLIGLVWGLVECLVAALVGGRLYSEA